MVRPESARVPAASGFCAVCQHEIQADEAESSTACGHRFHFQCILRSVRVSNACPVCRENVLPGDVVARAASSSSESCLSDSDTVSCDDTEPRIEIEVSADNIGQAAFDSLVSTLECMEEDDAVRAEGLPHLIPLALGGGGRLGMSVEAVRPPPPRVLPPTATNIIHHVKSGDIPQVRAMIAADRRLCCATDDAGDSLLHLAVMSQDQHMARYLATNADTNINSVNTARMSAMHYSVFTGSTHMVSLVLNRGGYIDATDSSGRTPLVYTVINNQTEMLQLLLDRGANCHVFDNMGETALHHAARSNSPSSVRILTRQRMVDVDASDAAGQTPLHVASMSNSHACVRLLLIAGANCTRKTKAGKLPVDCVTSRREGVGSILSLLRNNPAA